VVVLNNSPPEYVAIPFEKALIGFWIATESSGFEVPKLTVVTPPTKLAEPLVSQGVNEAADAESATAPRITPNTVRKATNDFMLISTSFALGTIRLFKDCLVNGSFGLIMEPETRHGGRGAADDWLQYIV
jgi:hypothetical protein